MQESLLLSGTVFVFGVSIGTIHCAVALSPGKCEGNSRADLDIYSS